MGVLRYDFPEVFVGTAEYDEGPTGCTLVCFEAGASCAVDVRGGAVAGRELHTVSLADAFGEVDGVLFTGGSTWGIDAAAGVMHRLSESRGGSVAYEDIPALPTAAVYDFVGRENTIYPDAELGLAAFDALATGGVPVGRRGAGANVTVGTYLGDGAGAPSGQGAAFAAHGPLKLLVIAVVNACGNVYRLDGTRVAGTQDHYERLVALLEEANPPAPPRGRGGNTLLLAVITNAALDRPELSRVAVMANAAAARVVDPFHTPEDGDVCFALSTQSARLPSGYTAGDVGVLASRLVQKAIVSAVEAASAAPRR